MLENFFEIYISIEQYYSSSLSPLFLAIISIGTPLKSKFSLRVFIRYLLYEKSQPIRSIHYQCNLWRFYSILGSIFYLYNGSIFCWNMMFYSCKFYNLIQF